MERIGSNRRRSLLDVKVDSPNPNSLAGLTLTAVLENHRPSIPTQADRTLFDIHNKKSWKLFRDKIRLGRAGAAWASSIRTPTSDVPTVNNNNNNTMISPRNSVRFATQGDPTPKSGQPGSDLGSALRQNLNRTPSLGGSPSIIHPGDNSVAEPPENHDRGAGEGGAEEDGEEPVRMSLMALLAETDREMGLDGSKYMIDSDEEEEEEEEGTYRNCCVCSVRHNGASSVACGHSFCRLCSRELSVERGNCPLCNRFISEILDFF